VQVVAFRHVPTEDLGLVQPALDEHGVAVEFADLHRDGAALPDITSAAGLIVMGGPMFANDDFPYLQTELQCIQSAVARGQPVLGMCLGAQMVAKAVGAKVYRNPVKEVGWCDVHWTEAARHDPLFAGLDGPETLMQWHLDTFDLPEGATHLAWSEKCRNQAFRLGANVYGFQFHLEVTPAMIANWCDQDARCGQPELDSPIDPERDRAHLAGLARLIFGRWCALLK